MKKLLLAMLILTLTIFAMASCDNSGDTNDDGANNGQNGNNQNTCEHANVIEVAAKKADCTTAGYSEGTKCADCGETISGMFYVAPYNHVGSTVKIAAIEPTCQASGRTEGSRCNACLKTLVATKVIPKLDHKEVANDEVHATCTEAGSTGGTHCSVCYTPIEEATMLEPTGEHTLYESKPAVPATDNSAALTAEKSCSVCKKIIEKQVEVPVDTDTP